MTTNSVAADCRDSVNRDAFPLESETLSARTSVIRVPEHDGEWRVTPNHDEVHEISYEFDAPAAAVFGGSFLLSVGIWGLAIAKIADLVHLR
jgi:hypothetical protein